MDENGGSSAAPPLAVLTAGAGDRVDEYEEDSGRGELLNHRPVDANVSVLECSVIATERPYINRFVFQHLPEPNRACLVLFGSHVTWYTESHRNLTLVAFGRSLVYQVT